MMFQAVSSLLLLSLFSVGQGNPKYDISVSNGGELGEWGPVEMCPDGSHARGFSLKVEKFQLFGDDTSLSGIQLHCVSSNNNGEYSIQSTEGAWGSWTSPVWCPNGNLIAFRLRVSPPQGDGDDTAANNIIFMCSDKTILEGSGQSWGTYGGWSQSCKIGICGIRTRVEEYQGKGDDTALNDVKFTCCKNPSFFSTSP
ncbi:vitelline membrane outer layer protein 1-like [Ascaphus truei]|uniref:vitelline membrane outer layer protein 1-like n=1 Tax=Ascaphus truei TaxID=8439 RepID=UPI003F5A23AC